MSECGDRVTIPQVWNTLPNLPEPNSEVFAWIKFDGTDTAVPEVLKYKWHPAEDVSFPDWIFSSDHQELEGRVLCWTPAVVPPILWYLIKEK